MENESIEDGIVALIKKAETDLSSDVVNALKKAHKVEQGIAKTQIETILKNIDLARKSGRPMCQDTGIQTFFVSIGIDFPYIDKIKEWIMFSY